MNIHKKPRKLSKRRVTDNESYCSDMSPSVITYLSPGKSSAKKAKKQDHSVYNVSYGGFPEYRNKMNESSEQILTSPNDNLYDFLSKVQKGRGYSSICLLCISEQLKTYQDQLIS